MTDFSTFIRDLYLYVAFAGTLAAAFTGLMGSGSFVG